MQVESEITSQGMRREEAQLEARKLHTQDEELVKSEEPKGILGSLWGSVKAATAAVTHMAHDAAVAAEHTGEKIVEQTKEIVLELEHQAEVGVGLAVNTAADIGSDLQIKAQAVSAQAQQKGEELLEQAKPTLDNLAAQAQVVGQQALVKGGELYEQARPTLDSLAGQALELGQQAVVKGEVLYEQAKPTLDSLATQALNKGEELYEQAKPTIDNLYEQAKPTIDIMYEQTKPALDKAKELGQELYEQAKPTSDTLTAQAQVVGQQAQSSLGLPLSRSASKKQLKKSASGKSIESEQWNGEPLILTMDVVSHIQRIADRTGDAVLHETARKAHSACAKGLSEAPGVHLVWITPSQANDLVNLAIRTQDHELADFARYCQSVAATTHVGVEPSPGKIQQEIQKGYNELQQQGRVHTGPGYGAAFASVNKTYAAAGNATTATATATATQQPATEQVQKTAQTETVAPPKLELTMDVVSHIQRIADRTGNALLHETARKAHSTCAKGLSDAPGVHLVWIAPQQASELMNLASRTQDAELIDFARYCQSVAATTQVGVEPAPGKIQEEILKGRQDVQKMVRQASQETISLASAPVKQVEVTEPVNISATAAAL